MSFDSAPCEARRHPHVTGQFVTRPGGMVMRPDHGGVHADRPLAAGGLSVTTSAQAREHPPPGAIGRPAPMPVVDRLPRTVNRRQSRHGQPVRVRHITAFTTRR